MGCLVPMLATFVWRNRNVFEKCDKPIKTKIYDWIRTLCCFQIHRTKLRQNECEITLNQNDYIHSIEYMNIFNDQKLIKNDSLIVKRRFKNSNWPIKLAVWLTQI